MKIPDVTIVIPAAIAALPDLSLAERVALAHIADHSACSNGDLARLLGISVRGVEQMVRRFRARGLIQQTGNGHARVFRLLFPVEHHSKCEEHQGAKPHTKSGKHEPGESHRSCGPSARPAANHPVATQPANRRTVTPDVCRPAGRSRRRLGNDAGRDWSGLMPTRPRPGRKRSRSQMSRFNRSQSASLT